MHPLIVQAWMLYELLNMEWSTARRLRHDVRARRLAHVLDRAWKRFERRCDKFGKDAQ
jgi:hypothetical protein